MYQWFRSALRSLFFSASQTRMRRANFLGITTTGGEQLESRNLLTGAAMELNVGEAAESGDFNATDEFRTIAVKVNVGQAASTGAQVTPVHDARAQVVPLRVAQVVPLGQVVAQVTPLRNGG